MKHALILLALTAAPAFAQESDQDFLSGFLEDSLSDAGRVVSITGFEGALSSRATMASLSIADNAGIWLVLEGVTLDWSQSALLSGELVVNELSADHLLVTRLPASSDSALLAAEASGFNLPELPVSIALGKIAIDRIDLEAAVLGQTVEGRLDAALALASGVGQARLSLTRTGAGPTGAINLTAGFDNQTRMLDLSLIAGEGEGGLVATALGLPGTPATDFRLAGSGPVEDFAAELTLATGGEERLAGTITLSGEAEDALRLQAALAGNPAPLFLPSYAGFLGSRLELSFDAVRFGSGAVEVQEFALNARSLSVAGTVAIAADGVPESVRLTGSLASPDGQPVLLPMSGPPIRIDRAAFEISTRKDDGLAWNAVVQVSGLDHPGLIAETLKVGGSGRIDRGKVGAGLEGALTVSASGMAATDPALAKALGKALTGSFGLLLPEGADALQLSDLKFQGGGLRGTGLLQIKGLGSAFLTSGKLALTTDELSRFDLLAGLPLAGQGALLLEGSASGLSGQIDGKAQLSATDLRIGIPQIDRLLAGKSLAMLSLLRDETGTTIRGFDVKAGSLEAKLSGKVASTDVDLAGNVALGDLSQLDPGYSGSAALGLALVGPTEAIQVSLSGQTDGLALGIVSADALLDGTSALTADLALVDGKLALKQLELSNPQLDLTLVGQIIGGLQELAVTGKLADLGLVVPDLSGALSVTGKLADTGDGFRLDLAGRGPGQVDATAEGVVSYDLASADLAISGTGQAGLANIFIAPRVLEGPTRFDLRLKGPIQLASLSGRVTLSDGRLSDPGFGFALERIEAIADLKSGKAVMSATAGLSTGGRLQADGPIGLSAPFPADLSLALDRVRFFDPKLYETILTGNLRIKGPVAGGATVSGALTLSETELRVPESGIDAAGILMELDHRNEPTDVRATRYRASLLGDSGIDRKGSATAYRLDLLLSAPSRIFLRGRGIDAELGGELRLGGTTASVVPAGEFTLIRGRLDILGKRLTLERADLALAGSFVPELDILASADSDGITSLVAITGSADNPKVSFTSSPELPEEEVLAMLLFGHGLANISPLQAAQLAQAVATLAGRGGEGVIGKLRKGFGLDDLDLATAEDGTGALRAGKYISENLYTEVEVDQTGTTTINLNLDLRPGVTVKGRVGADGETGIGVFVEQDY